MESMTDDSFQTIVLTSVYITTDKLGELNSWELSLVITSMAPKAKALYFWSDKAQAKF